MKTIDNLFSKLKSKTIHDRKPNLKLCSNHYKDKNGSGRWWNSHQRGQATSNGKGWYR